MFFVLSGFLIGSILINIFENRKGHLSFHDIRIFWIRRWMRTLPNYYLILIVSIVFRVFSDHIHNRPLSIGVEIWSYVIFLQNAFTAHPEFFNEAWSLSIEEWFYLSFPITLIFFSSFLRINQKHKILITISSYIIFFTLLRLIIVEYVELEWNTGIRRMLFLRLDSIGIGVLFAYIQFYYKEYWVKYRYISICFGLILTIGASVVFYWDVLVPNSTEKTNFFTKIFLFNTLGLGFALWFPWLSNIRNVNPLFRRIFIHLSVTSYSIYLTHSLIFAICNKLPFPPEFLLLLGWLLTMLVSTVLFNLYEYPIMQLRERFVPSEKKEKYKDALVE